MYEASATWTLTGSDGTVVTMNGGNVLAVEEVTGFDSPNMRENIEDLPEQDGAIAGDYFLGSRPITFSGRVIGSTATVRNAQVVSLQRAVRGLRGDCVIKSTASGLPAMQANARLQNLRVTGGFVKQFQLGMVCADPRIYSQALNTQSRSGTGTVSCTNAGNFDARPVIRVTAMNTPTITNTTTGLALTLSYNITAGHYVDIDMAARTAIDDTAVSHYNSITFPTNWWTLAPGANTITLSGTTNTGAALSVSWRDTWL